jgi:DNA replication protein DnaC
MAWQSSTLKIRREVEPSKSEQPGTGLKVSVPISVPKLLRELAVARVDGRYAKLLTGLARTELIVLDDWGMASMADTERRDLYEILEDRTGLRSTIVTSQIPIDKWHQVIGDPTIADAILDRLTSDAYRFDLQGESMRRKKLQLSSQSDQDEDPC